MMIQTNLCHLNIACNADFFESIQSGVSFPRGLHKDSMKTCTEVWGQKGECIRRRIWSLPSSNQHGCLYSPFLKDSSLSIALSGFRAN